MSTTIAGKLNSSTRSIDASMSVSAQKSTRAPT